MTVAGANAISTTGISNNTSEDWNDRVMVSPSVAIECDTALLDEIDITGSDGMIVSATKLYLKIELRMPFETSNGSALQPIFSFELID